MTRTGQQTAGLPAGAARSGRHAALGAGLAVTLSVGCFAVMPPQSAHTTPGGAVGPGVVARPAGAHGAAARRGPTTRAEPLGPPRLTGPVRGDELLLTRASRGGPRRTLLADAQLQVEPVGPSFTGLASWYGEDFQGRPTASGVPFDMALMTAASRTLPLDSELEICLRDKCVVVLVNDRGPYVEGRVLDLSRAAARELGYDGVAEVTATPVRTRRVPLPAGD